MLSKIRLALRTGYAFVTLLLWPYFYMYFYFTFYYFATKRMNGEIIWFYHIFFVYLLADCSVMFLSMAISRRWQRIKTNESKAKCETLPQGGKSHFTLSYGGDMITDLIIAYYFYCMYLVVLILNKKTFSHYTSTYCITFRLK